jgi:hypothetical protein
MEKLFKKHSQGKLVGDSVGEWDPEIKEAKQRCDSKSHRQSYCLNPSWELWRHLKISPTQEQESWRNRLCACQPFIKSCPWEVGNIDS